MVGGGLAGLSAAVTLASAPGGHDVVLHEAAPRAGGRCRSWHDAELGVEIDNGTHALLGANPQALAYLARIGAEDRVHWLDGGIEFLDLRDGARWRVRGPSDMLRAWRHGGSGAAREIALLLRLFAHPERFLQTASAMLGVACLLAPISIPLVSLVRPQAGQPVEFTPAVLLTLALSFFLVFINARILRAAIERPMFQCVVLFLLGEFLVFAVMLVVGFGGA
ncbi:MAG: FAD-dependent oxidoreductase [Alphaproteobacteria bacterium]